MTRCEPLPRCIGSGSFFIWRKRSVRKMANELGSFIVSIKAQIEGYQEQIARIKQELAKVGQDTDIGKEIAKSLKLAESQVNRLGKTMEKRISSESQITSLTDNLQNILPKYQCKDDTGFKLIIHDKMTGELKEYLYPVSENIKELTVKLNNISFLDM